MKLPWGPLVAPRLTTPMMINILREIDTELADLDNYHHSLDDSNSKRGHSQGQVQGRVPKGQSCLRSASKRSADRGQVELLGTENEAGSGARFVSGLDNDDDDDDNHDFKVNRSMITFSQSKSRLVLWVRSYLKKFCCLLGR